MLKVDIRGVEMEITEAIGAAIEEKLAVLDKYLESAGTPRDLRVEVGKTTHHHHKGEVFRVDANLTIPGHVIRAEEVASDLYVAIDLAKDKLKNEIIKATKTQIDEKRDGAREAKENATETELI